MFAQIKQIFSPKHKDLRKRILFTLSCLLIFVIGKAIVVPGIPKVQLTGNLGFFEFFNVIVLYKTNQRHNMTNILKAIHNFSKYNITKIGVHYKNTIRIQQVGDSLEYFIKDLLAD